MALHAEHERTQMLHGSIAIDEQYPGSAFGTGIRKRPSMNFVLVSPSLHPREHLLVTRLPYPLSIFATGPRPFLSRK